MTMGVGDDNSWVDMPNEQYLITVKDCLFIVAIEPINK